METQTNRNGVGALLDETRAHLKTRQRHWLGQSPRNSSRQIPLAKGLESKLCTGALVSINDEGKLTVLSEGTQFAGVCIGVGLNPQGNPVGTVRLGVLWAPVEGLSGNTKRDVPVFADPVSQKLTLAGGVPIGRLTNVEEFGGGLRGHVELEVGLPQKAVNSDLKEIKR